MVYVILYHKFVMYNTISEKYIQILLMDKIVMVFG